jgi:hypothetical protein
MEYFNISDQAKFSVREIDILQLLGILSPTNG